VKAKQDLNVVWSSGFNKETSDRRKLSWETLWRGEKET